MSITGKALVLTPDSPDWGEVLEQDLGYFPRPWSRPSWEDLDWERHLLLGWKMGERLIGFALCSYLVGDNAAHLLKIFLLPEYRSKGQAVLFWRELSFHLKERGASQVYLEVEAENVRAISFYQKLGFQKLRVAKNYYSDGADAWIMQLEL